MSVTIWHNPRCTKSRQTLQLLQDQGIEPEVRLYLEDAPDVQELRDVLAMLGQDALALTRHKEAEFKAAGLSKSSTEEDLIAALATTPKLIERPVVINGGRAAIGRPPEAVLDIL